MNVSDVTNQDGQRCANLINFLKAGKWELTGVDAEALHNVKQWVHGLAMSMAKQLAPTPAGDSPTKLVQPASPPPAAPGGFKVTGMGPIGSSKPGKKRKK